MGRSGPSPYLTAFPFLVYLDCDVRLVFDSWRTYF